MAGLAKKALKIAGKIATPLSAIGIASDMFKGKKKEAVAPAADPRQTVMPTADDEAIRKAKKRSIYDQMRRSGRMSTILTDGGDKLGG